MPLDILTIGEALVEVMHGDSDQPLNRPGPFQGLALFSVYSVYSVAKNL